MEKEIRTIEKNLERQNRQAYDKIFGDYIPIFETDPSDLVNEFLAE
jgi:hypothetical protein